MQRTGADIIVTLLERQGVTTIAGIPGGSNLPLYDALGQSDAIRHILCRHEQAAGFIAQGMARVTGRPGVCLATSGPGATNLLTAVADARLDSIPLVAITGQAPLAMIGTDAFQEVDTYGMSVPVTKHNVLVRSAQELLAVIPEAFRIAASGRPGPVWIDVPKDVQKELVTFDEWPEPGRADPTPQADSRSLDEAARLMRNAGRPVIYAGGGIVHSGASEVLLELAERTHTPVTMTLNALGAMPYDHPLSLGMLGMHGSRWTNAVLDRADLLVVLGARFDDRATGRLADFCPHAHVVHVDIDAAELGKLRTAHVPIRADARSAIEGLLERLDTIGRADWLGDIAALRREMPPAPAGSDDASTPCGLLQSIAAGLDDDAIVVTDVGQHQMWAAQSWPFRHPRRWLTSGGLGTMGFGLPAAIGAALAEPERTVVCVTGDGSLLMNLQELATAAELGVNVKIVLMNNASLGLVRQQQELFYGRRTFASEYAGAIDFAQVAEGLGVPAWSLAVGDAAGTLETALSRRGPCLLNVPVSAGEMVWPMVPPGGANTESMDPEAEGAEACA